MGERLFKIARCCCTTLANVEGFCYFCVKCLKPRQHPVERIPPPQSRSWRSSGVLTLAITFKKLINSFRVDNVPIHQTSRKSNTTVNKQTDRQTDRQTHTQRHTHTDTQINKHGSKHYPCRPVVHRRVVLPSYTAYCTQALYG